jgi:phosphopantothenoylcysteine decarboxylase/phosphopantothenate--cysteine ligase
MGDAVLAEAAEADVLFMVAAVADFRPSAVADRKIKKTENADWGLAIGLEKTLDILSAVKEQRERTGNPRVVLGFAAETHNAFEYGREKLLRKGLDFIAINDVMAEQTGFAFDTNQITLLGPSGVIEEIPLQSKLSIAERLVYHVAGALEK